MKIRVTIAARIIGFGATLIGLGASLLTDWVNEKKMNEQIEARVNEALSVKNEEEES